MMYDAPMIRLVACLVLAAGCASSGTSGKSETAAPPPPSVGAPLATAGARCAGATCRCRPVDQYNRGTEGNTANEGSITPGEKRFEVRTGRGFDQMTISIDGAGTLTKDTSQTEPSCGYFDLPPGRHAVRVKISAQDRAQGIHPRILVNEYGKETHDWYDTFAFACGANAPCIKDDMGIWLDEVRKVDRGIFDKCGSTRVENVRWSVEHSPEQTLEDLVLDFTLHVYKFDPRFPHGAPNCKGLSGGHAAENELAQ
jgi:hypothetical protein